MRFGVDPRRPLGYEVRRVAAECLDDALARLEAVRDALPDASPDVEEAVHAARRRCKEVRGLARLVRAELGAGYATFNGLVRDGARELSRLRDAHALVAAAEGLAAHATGPQLAAVHAARAGLAGEATTVTAGDPRIERARQLLAEARHAVDGWKIGDDFAALGPGLQRTYGTSRRAWRAALDEPTADLMHAWRRDAKYLWYQIRLIRAAAPDRVRPLARRLEKLGELLGDDHDLAVLIERLSAEPERFGRSDDIDSTIALARARQDDLRRRAFHVAAKIWAERPRQFVKHVRTAWETAAAGEVAGEAAIERERKFLVEELPDLARLDPPTRVRQGYLMTTERGSARVRAATDPDGTKYTLTVKSGEVSARLELEAPITAEQFAAAWPHTGGRRVDKQRYRIPHGGLTIELDVFADTLDGLILAEVEFPDAEALAGFDPPSWFATEVTDDPRYQNSALATDGAPHG